MFFKPCAALVCALGTVAIALPQPQPPAIRIGAVVAATGNHAFEGRATRLGYEFWAAWVNNHGGVTVGGKKYRIELVERDDESNPALTTQLTERLINEEQVAFILGPYGSAETLAASAVTERKGIPLVTGTGASEKAFGQGYHYLFGVMSPARMYSHGPIDIARSVRPRVRTAAVIAANDSFSLEAQQGAIQYAQDAGITVINTDRYPTGTRDFRPITARLAIDKPEMIIHAGHTLESIAFTRALFDANIRANIYAEVVGPELPAYAYFLGALSDDTLSAAQWSRSTRARGSSAYFVASAPEYAKAFARFAKVQAGSEHASASAAGLALEIAIAHAGSLDPERVRKSLQALHATTFYGNIAFDSRGLNVTKPMYANQLELGKLHAVYPRAGARRLIYPARAWRDR